MPGIEIVGLASPTQSEWAIYMSLFADEPNFAKIMRYLKIRNHLEIKRCARLFEEGTLRKMNARLSRAGYDVRLIASTDTIDLPFEERVIHLYSIRTTHAKTPA